MSVKKELYKSIKGIIDTNTCIKHFGLFNSQFDNMGEENTFPFPCVFLEFLEINSLSIQEGAQQSEITLRVHIGFESIATEDLELFDIVEDVHVALQGFSKKDEQDKDVFTPLERTSETQDTNHDNVIVWMADYTTLVHDNSSHRNNKLVQTQIDELCLNKDMDEPRLMYIKSV